MNNNYFYDTSDEKINELANDVYELYMNKDITTYKHTGKKLSFKYETLLSRKIPGVYSNIKDHLSLNTLLSNAIRLSLNYSQQNQSRNDIKTYRETCERFKLALTILMRKKQSKPNEIDPTIDDEIEAKKKEIKILEEKINEMANAANAKPEINNRILNISENIYNIMLRNDRVPKLLYIKICKKLNVRLEYSEHFVDDRDKPESIHMIKHKKNAYVPPAFRKDNDNINQNYTKVYNSFDDMDKNQSHDDYNNKYNNDEYISEKNNKNDNSNNNLGAWAIKSKNIFKDEDKKNENIKDKKDEKIKSEDIKLDNVSKSKINNDIKLNTEWENSDDF